jgi:tetratricopeptide (TPR) repeat protein
VVTDIPLATGDVLARARALIELGEVAQARDLLRAGWEENERRPDLVVALAQAYDSLDQRSGAEGVLVEALAAWPDNRPVRLALAWHLLRDSAFQSALDTAAPLLDLPNRLPDADFISAAALRGLARYDEALATLHKAEAKFGASPRLTIARGETLLQAGRDSEAVDELRRACSRWGENTGVIRLLARALLKTREFSACVSLLEPFFRIPTKNCVLEYNLFAKACLREGSYEKVVEWLSPTRDFWPDRNVFAIHLLAAAAALRRGDIANEVRRMLQAPLSNLAVSTAQENADALTNRALSDAASDFAGWILEVDPKSARVQRLLASVKSRCGDTVGARSVYHAMRELGSLDARAALEYAQLLWQSGDEEHARVIFDDAVQYARSPVERVLASTEFVQFLISIGDFGEADLQLCRADTNGVPPRYRHRLDWLRITLNGMIGGTLKKVGDTPAPDELFEGGSIAHYRFSEERCVVWFGGILPANLGIFLNYCLPTWRRLGFSLLTVTDSKRLASVGGFGPYFPDRGAAEAALSRLISELGYPEVVTMGGSLSAYSAVLYGCRMGAAGALSISGLSYLHSPSRIADTRYLRTLQRVLRSVQIDEPDLAPVLQARPDFVVHQHFGALSAFDVDHMKNIEWLPNVRLFADDHGRHDSIHWLHERGLLEDRIRGFVDAVGF